jgi:WD40 repeat protein
MRLLTWSADGSLLVLTSGAGRVYLYDEEGNLMYSLVSSNLPSWDAPSVGDSQHKSFCKAFFSPPPRMESGNQWIVQLTLVNFDGRMTTFLLSATGYQEMWSVSLSSHYPLGITDAALVPDTNLLYVAGPSVAAAAHAGMTCWRLLDGDPHIEEVHLSEKSGENHRRFWTSWLTTSSDAASDFVYHMEVSPDGKRLATVQISGTISVWSLPALLKQESVSLQEQACHDDISPQFLQKPNDFLRSFYDNNALKWHPITVRWWDGNALIVSRVSGGVTIVSLGQEDEESKNLLGESAEFFSPGHRISQCFESGTSPSMFNGESPPV